MVKSTFISLYYKYCSGGTSNYCICIANAISDSYSNIKNRIYMLLILLIINNGHTIKRLREVHYHNQQNYDRKRTIEHLFFLNRHIFSMVILERTFLSETNCRSYYSIIKIATLISFSVVSQFHSYL